MGCSKVQDAAHERNLGEGGMVLVSTRSPSSALLPTFLGEGSPTKIDCRKKGTLILTSLLEDLAGC